VSSTHVGVFNENENHPFLNSQALGGKENSADPTRQNFSNRYIIVIYLKTF
jgi:hypothetical protein